MKPRRFFLVLFFFLFLALLIFSFQAISVTEEVQWNTVQDWNEGITDSDLVHENINDTNHSDASKVRIGYNYTTPRDIDLSFYYPFDEVGNFSTAQDLSGNNNNGSIIGDVQLGDTGISSTKAFRFNNSTDGNAVDSGIMNITSDQSFSITSWVSMSVDETSRIVSKDRVGEAGQFILFYRNSIAAFECAVRSDGGTWFRAQGTTNPGANLDVYFHVGCTWDTTDSTVTIYVNGSEEDSDTGLEVSMNTNDLPIVVGSDSDKANQFWHGKIEEPRFYNRTLSPTEMSNLADLPERRENKQIETDSKSFSQPVKPNLRNMKYNLNTGSIDIEVVGSPESGSREVNSISLTGQTSENLAWATSHTTFRLENITLLTDDTDASVDQEKTPILDAISLRADTTEAANITDLLSEGLTIIPKETNTDKVIIHSAFFNETLSETNFTNVESSLVRIESGQLVYWNESAQRSQSSKFTQPMQNISPDILWRTIFTNVSNGTWTVIVKAQTDFDNTTVNTTDSETIEVDNVIEIAGLQASGLIEMAIWGSLILFSLHKNWPLVAIFSTMAIFGPIFRSVGSTWPINFIAGVMLNLLAIWMHRYAEPIQDWLRTN